MSSRNYIHQFIKRRNLFINYDKEYYYNPGDRIEFLGLFIQNDVIDVNKKARDKAMRSVRQLGRAYRKEVELGNKTEDIALHCFLRKINGKFYGWDDPKKSWSNWYFPLINTDSTLLELDHQIQEWARFIITGKHNKRNYTIVSYQKLKDFGFIPLVNSFYNRNINV